MACVENVWPRSQDTVDEDGLSQSRVADLVCGVRSFLQPSHVRLVQLCGIDCQIDVPSMETVDPDSVRYLTSLGSRVSF